jgi:predicted phosphodiesterase
VLADIAARGGADAYWVLGDLVALGPDPVGVLDRLRALPNASFIRGNTDRYTTTRERPVPSIEDVRADPTLLERWREVEASFSWTQGAISAAGAFTWIDELDLDVRMTLRDGTRLLAVHAAPGLDDGTGILPRHSDDEVAVLLDRCDADLVVVGHTHVPIDRTVFGVRVVNPGPVSNAPAPDLRAKYAILAADANHHELVTYGVDYDRNAVIEMLERVRHPGRGYISQYMRGEIEPTWAS